LIAIITTAEDVRQAAVIYLPWAALSALSGVLAFQMDGIFIGATWSRDMRNMMLLSVIFFLAALLLLPPLFGNHGLWAALHIFLLARGFTLFAALRKRGEATLRMSLTPPFSGTRWISILLPKAAAYRVTRSNVGICLALSRRATTDWVVPIRRANLGLGQTG
jgi:hypothetical protein